MSAGLLAARSGPSASPNEERVPFGFFGYPTATGHSAAATFTGQKSKRAQRMDGPLKLSLLPENGLLCGSARSAACSVDMLTSSQHAFHG